MNYENLVNGIKNKDNNAITEFYKEFYKDVYYVCLKITENDKDAEDVAQEVLFRAINKIELLHSPEGLPAWLRTIANNLSINYLKKNRKFDMVDSCNDEDDEIIKEQASEDKALEDVVADKEVSDILFKMIEKLPKEQRVTVFMFYFEELSVREISEAMDCSEATVRSRLNYAKKALRKQVEELENEGVKFRCIAILPFLGAIYSFEKNSAYAQVALPSALMSAENITGVSAATASQQIGGSSVVTKEVGKESVRMMKKAGMGLGTKIAIGATVAALTIGGVCAAVFLGGSDDKDSGKGGSNTKTESSANGELDGLKEVSTEPTMEINLAGRFGDLALGVSYMAPLDKDATTSFDSKNGTWLLMNGARHDVDSGVEVTVINGLKSFDDVDTMFVDHYKNNFISSSFGYYSELDNIEITSKEYVKIGDMKALYYEGNHYQENKVAGYIVDYKDQLLNFNVWYLESIDNTKVKGLEHAVQMILSLEDYNGEMVSEIGEEGNELSGLFRKEAETVIGDKTYRINYPGQINVDNNTPTIFDALPYGFDRLKMNVIEDESIVNSQDIVQALYDYTANKYSFMVKDVKVETKEASKVTIAGIEMDKHVVVDYSTRYTITPPEKVTVMYSFIVDGKLVVFYDCQEVYNYERMEGWNRDTIPTAEEMQADLDRCTAEAERITSMVIRNLTIE